MPVDLCKNKKWRGVLTRGVWIIGLGSGIWGLFLLRQRIKCLNSLCCCSPKPCNASAFFLLLPSHFWFRTSADSSL